MSASDSGNPVTVVTPLPALPLISRPTRTAAGLAAPGAPLGHTHSRTGLRQLGHRLPTAGRINDSAAIPVLCRLTFAGRHLQSISPGTTHGLYRFCVVARAARLAGAARAPHHDDLVEAVKDGELWELVVHHVPEPDGMRAEIDRRLGLQRAGSMIPFAVIEEPTGRAVGMTTFMNIDARQPARGNRLHLVPQARAAQRLEHRVQAAAFDPCFRTLELHRRGIPHPFLQSSEPRRHRAFGRKIGRGIAAAPDRPKRHPARHLLLTAFSTASGRR